jgi:SAM-dependent methyltransferase
MVTEISSARILIERATALLGWMHRNQRLVPPFERPLKLNLGAGLRVAPGWVNIDGSINAWIAGKPRWTHSLAYRLSGARQFYPRPTYYEILRRNVFVHHNLTYGIPLPDATVDFLYSSHFLEHLDQTSARKLLAECFRVLRPEGVIRIAVPDLEYALEMYRRGEKERMLHDLFYGGTGAGFSQHRFAYDFEMLAAALRDAGFRDVERAEARRGRTPDLVLLDNREDFTLFVEARPAAARPALQKDRRAA